MTAAKSDDKDSVSAKHPHEPQIPPVLAEDGHCRICRLLVKLDEANDYIRRMDAVIDDAGVARSCINPLEDLKRAVAYLKKAAAVPELMALSGETPRTDAAAYLRPEPEGDRFWGERKSVVSADFARQLERELNDTTKRLDACEAGCAEALLYGTFSSTSSTDESSMNDSAGKQYAADSSSKEKP